ncbi:unnamed protein product [Ilex paraguariensis]|uniref:Uncharacterized protein n=1 Tax=Ilex paraguariensis TaxID=185542 RepID=A0ABC8SH26_9AQUA
MSTTIPSGTVEEEPLTLPLLNGNLRRSASNTTSQVAIVGSNPCPIESLDYESLRFSCLLEFSCWWFLICRLIENHFFKQDWRSRGKIEICQYIFMKWILCFLIGFIVSLIGFTNNLAVENIAGMKFVVTSNMMLAKKLESISVIYNFSTPISVVNLLKFGYWAAFLVFASSNFGLTLFACLITAFIAPEAAGSGIPEVKAYLNGVDAPAIFSLRTLVVKVIWV